MHQQLRIIRDDSWVWLELPLVNNAKMTVWVDRGWDLFAGFLQDNEAYFAIAQGANNYPKRREYFVGTSLKGFLRGRFDLTLRPTRFTSDVKGINFQKNSQFRPDLIALIKSSG